MSRSPFVSPRKAADDSRFRSGLHAGQRIDVLSSDGRWVRGHVVATDGHWEKVKVEIKIGGRPAIEWVDAGSQRIANLGEMTSTQQHANESLSDDRGYTGRSGGEQMQLIIRHYRRHAGLWLVVAVAVPAAGWFFDDFLAGLGNVPQLGVPYMGPSWQMAEGSLNSWAFWLRWVGLFSVTWLCLLPALLALADAEIKYGTGNFLHRFAVEFLQEKLRFRSALNRMNLGSMSDVADMRLDPTYGLRLGGGGRSRQDRLTQDQLLFQQQQRLAGKANGGGRLPVDQTYDRTAFFDGLTEQQKGQSVDYRAATRRHVEGSISRQSLEKAMARSNGYGFSPHQGGARGANSSFGGSSMGGSPTMQSPAAGLQSPFRGGGGGGTPGGGAFTPGRAGGGGGGGGGGNVSGVDTMDFSQLNSTFSPIAAHSPAYSQRSSAHSGSFYTSPRHAFDDITSEQDLDEYFEEESRMMIASDVGNISAASRGRSPSPTRRASNSWAYGMDSSLSGSYLMNGEASLVYNAEDTPAKGRASTTGSRRAGYRTGGGVATVYETPEGVLRRLHIETRLMLQWSWNMLQWIEKHIIQYVGKQLFENPKLTLARGNYRGPQTQPLISTELLNGVPVHEQATYSSRLSIQVAKMTGQDPAAAAANANHIHDKGTIWPYFQPLGIDGMTLRELMLQPEGDTSKLAVVEQKMAHLAHQR
eukprot:SAG22_NODE_1100_length_5563_cov_24.716874_4_plen_698_part_00